jgi:hypothetical protein
MSQPLMLFLAFIAFVVALSFWQFTSLPGSIFWRAKRASRRHREHLLAASTETLLVEARGGVQFERWERFPSGKRLLDEEIRTDESLREGLRKLFDEVVQEDREKSQHGRDSNHFEFHDSGLAVILEVLEERLEAPPNAGPFR